MTSQGEYGTDDFEGENAYFLWIVFFGVTFFIQITFLNMLIAIIGNTFQHVLDNKQQSAMKERIKIISDFRLMLRLLEPDVEFQYIFEIKPKVENNESGIVASVKQAIEDNSQ